MQLLILEKNIQITTDTTVDLYNVDECKTRPIIGQFQDSCKWQKVVKKHKKK